MKGKEGQSLILFIVFLPLMLIAFAFIVDVGLMYSANIKGNSLLKEAEKEEINIEEYFKNNDLEIKSIETTGNCRKITYEIDSIFGSLIGYETYTLKIDNC